MKKLILSALLFAALAGCKYNRTPEQLEQEKIQQAYEHQLRQQRDVESAKHQIDAQNQWLHSCDSNGGVVSISHSRYDTTLTCANKLESKLSSFQ
jgi:hypothetical protein